MSKYMRIVLVFALVFLALPVLPVAASDSVLPDGCYPVSLQYPAIGFACFPVGPVPWNGDLVIFAHGYVPNVGQPPEIPISQLVLDGVSVPGMVTGMGYAFAVTSYRVNGLAIKDGVADLAELRQATINLINRNLDKTYIAPPHTYVVGVSEGGLIATQAIEQRPDIFSGALACCGPIGDFRKQINYWGDFRVVYDYFFPKTLANYGDDAMHIPSALINDWLFGEGQDIKSLVIAGLADTSATTQLLSVTGAPYNASDLSTVGMTVVGILDYSVLATNDGVLKLGGVPFNNKAPKTVYNGSENDFALNKRVARFKADKAAINEINTFYQTTGILSAPLVTMHTTGDPIVPYWHEVLYTAKNWRSGTWRNRINIPIVRYGHCSFTPAELIFGFYVLVFKATGSWSASAEQALPTSALREQFRSLQTNRNNSLKSAVE